MSISRFRGHRVDELGLVNATPFRIKAMGYGIRIHLHAFEFLSEDRACIRLLDARTARKMKDKQSRLELMPVHKVIELQDRCEELYEAQPEKEKSQEAAFREAWAEVSGQTVETVDEEKHRKRREDEVKERLGALRITPRPNWSLEWMEMVAANPELQYENPETYDPSEQEAVLREAEARARALRAERRRSSGKTTKKTSSRKGKTAEKPPEAAAES